MTTEPPVLTAREGAVLTLTLNRPSRLNALDFSLLDSLLTRDEYLLLADYQSYVDCQARVSDAYRNPSDWTRMSILNTAGVGGFSSDRSIRSSPPASGSSLGASRTPRPGSGR
jgi:hypothetical protein